MQGLIRPRALLAAGAMLAGLATMGAAAAPSALQARCAAAAQASEAAEKSFGEKTLDFLRGSLKFTLSTVGDQFSITGKDGPFACSPIIVQRAAKDRVRQKAEADAAKVSKGPVKSKGLNLAAQADVSGALRPTLFHMPQTQTRLQAIVDDIAAAWPYKGTPPVKVLMSANLGYNAEARADNTIVVWLGVLAGPETGVSQDITDSDLYYLLGHEYAHLALDHMRSEELGEKQRRFLHDAARIYQRGAMLESSIVYAESNTSDQDSDLKEAYRDAKEAHQHLRFTMDHLLYPVWGRMQEDEADTAGIDVAFLAGVTPRYVHSVDQFEASEQTVEKRIAAIQTNMGDRAAKVIKDPRFKAALDQGELSTAFNSVLEALKKGLYEGVRKWLIDVVSRDHRSAKARREGMGKYMQTAYVKGGLLPEDAELASAEADRLRALPELANAIVAARAVAAAEQALDAKEPDNARAAKQIAIALKGPFAGEAYVRFTAARVALAHNRTAEAITHLELARKSRYPSPEAYRKLVELYANSGRVPLAKTIIVEGRKKIPDSDYFLPSDIRVQVRLRQFQGLAKSFEACRNSDRDQIMLDCQAAALDAEYKALSEKDRARLEDLAYWGEEPKARRNGGGDSFNFESLIPWGKQKS